MTASIGHHHRKNHLDEEEIVPLEIADGNNVVVDESSSSSDVTFHDLEQLAGLRNINGDNEHPNVGSSTTSHGVHHGKHSTDRNYHPPTTPSPTPKPTPVVFASLRDVHQSSSNSHGSSNTLVHQKYSREKTGVNPDELPNYTWTTRTTTSLPPTLSPTNETPGPTVDIRRVNPAQIQQEEVVGEKLCRANNDGVYFGMENARNGGVVLRYQYELLVQEVDYAGESSRGDTTAGDSAQGGMVSGLDGDGGEGGTRDDGMQYLVQDVLPKLEGRISDALIPVFFDECLNVVDQGEGGRRLFQLQEEEGVEEARQQQNKMLRSNRRLNKVIGIDAKPHDFPLSQQECEFISNPQVTTQHCHRVEGALTLYFPPNYSLSTLLSSTALATLRAIEGGMNDGSLRLAHDDIRKLHFLSSSYDLHPTVLLPNDDAESVLEDGSSEGGNIGLILGIIIPLLLLGCCCCCCGIGLFLWKRRRDNKPEDDESSVGSDDIVNAKRIIRREERRSSRNDDVAGRRRGGLDDYDEEEDTDTDDDQGTTSSDDSYNDDTTSTNRSGASQRSKTSNDDNSDSSNSNNSRDSEEEETNVFPAYNPLDPIFENQRREKEKKRKLRKRHARIRRRWERMNDDASNSGGGGGTTEEDDGSSVVTGATGATGGVHSLSSQATARVKNDTVVVGEVEDRT